MSRYEIRRDAQSLFDIMKRRVERRHKIDFKGQLPPDYVDNTLRIAEFGTSLILVAPTRPPIIVMADGRVDKIRYEVT